MTSARRRYNLLFPPAAKPSKGNITRFVCIEGNRAQVIALDRRRKRNVIAGRGSPITIYDDGLSYAKIMAVAFIVRIKERKRV